MTLQLLCQNPDFNISFYIYTYLTSKFNNKTCFVRELTLCVCNSKGFPVKNVFEHRIQALTFII